MLVLNNYCLCITDREILSCDLFRCSIVNVVLKAPFSYSFFIEWESRLSIVYDICSSSYNES